MSIFSQNLECASKIRLEKMEAKEIQKLLELAENREEIGDHEGAKKSYAAALELARSSQNEQLNLICGYNFGTALVNTGEPRKGVEILLKMLRFGKKYPCLANPADSQV